jgi:hypothetical protein
LITPLKLRAFASADLKAFDVTVYESDSSTESRAQMDGKKEPYIASVYRGADKSLARPGRNQATATGDFDVHMSYL